MPTMSIPFLICSIVFLVVGVVLGYLSFSYSEGFLEEIRFTSWAVIAVATGFVGINWLCIW